MCTHMHGRLPQLAAAAPAHHCCVPARSAQDPFTGQESHGTCSSSLPVAAAPRCQVGCLARGVTKPGDGPREGPLVPARAAHPPTLPLTCLFPTYRCHPTDMHRGTAAVPSRVWPLCPLKRHVGMTAPHTRAVNTQLRVKHRRCRDVAACLTRTTQPETLSRSTTARTTTTSTVHDEKPVLHTLQGRG